MRHLPLLPLALFVATYLGLAAGRIPRLALDRTGCALLGAIAFLASGTLDLGQAAASVDTAALAVLFGMMLLSEQYQLSGLYAAIGHRLARVRNPRHLLAGTIVVAAALSAVLTNDVICFALTPLLARALLASRRDPLPYLLGLAAASNLGSALTPIGNPQNILIAQRLHLHFLPFVAACAVPVVLSLALLNALLVGRVVRAAAPDGVGRPAAAPAGHAGEAAWAMRDRAAGERAERRLAPLASGEPPEEVPARGDAAGAPAAGAGPAAAAAAAASVAAEDGSPRRERGPRRLGWPAAKAVGLTVLAVCLFLTPVPAALTALGVAGGVLLSRRAATRALLEAVDWPLLALFVSLFIVVRGFEASGWAAAAAAALAAHGAGLFHPAVLVTVTAVLSNLVSNVPATMLLLPLVGHQPATGYALALASTFSGNALLVGSIANLIVVERAAALGVRIGFRDHLRLGLPLAVMSLALAAGAVALWR
jgi:Na+/H+ antiporter NhaD/arsenite permease-like protein